MLKPNRKEMDLKRHNSFRLVHKGLRLLMYSTATRLQQANLASRSDGSAVMEQVQLVLNLFESHAHGEDHYFNEPLEKINPDVSTLFQKEHEEDHRLSAVLHDQLKVWFDARSDEDREIIGNRIFYTFNEFVAFNLYHMNKEEIMLNQALWNAYSDEQIRSIEQELVKNIPPAKMMSYAKWIFGGINDAEATEWLTGIQMNAPAEVFSAFKQIAAQTLPPERWESIQANLEKVRVSVA
jgi:hypothetical protein